MIWLTLAVGALTLISPWILGFGGSVIAWTNAAFGTILILAGAWMLFNKEKKN